MQDLGDQVFFTLSIAGIKPLEPPPAAPETLSSVYMKYVMVPLDVLLRYKNRAEEVAVCIRKNQRLVLISQLDGQERSGARSMVVPMIRSGAAS